MKLGKFRDKIPAWKSSLLAVLAAAILILAFPDFELWFLGWFALIPLLWAIAAERDSIFRSGICGWMFGVVFFVGTSWWLTFAPITYAGFPPLLAYFLLLIVCMIVAVFPAVFAGIMAFLLRRLGPVAMLAVPFVWVFTEFARYWITGNNWNAVGYSQAFNDVLLPYAAVGGVLMVSWACLVLPSLLVYSVWEKARLNLLLAFSPLLAWLVLIATAGFIQVPEKGDTQTVAKIVAIQPNIPMAGLTVEKWRDLRERHVQMAETAIKAISSNPQSATRDPQLIVIFPESPMNFMYEEDVEFQAFIHSFAQRNNVNVLFNSAEPNMRDGKYFNSAVMVSPEGREVQQYDKIYLVPFGESVPAPLQSVVPAFVGSFSYGSEYDLFPVGDAQAGVMICFESHFGQLSREYVRNGADVLIEMTNDGYLGPTPILRQHLANAVFRSIETNRPVLRVTNVGITTYIDARGEVRDPAESYIEDTRVWSVAKSDGSQTFYVRYGDWFAWLCALVTVALLILGTRRVRNQPFVNDL